MHTQNDVPNSQALIVNMLVHWWPVFWGWIRSDSKAGAKLMGWYWCCLRKEKGSFFIPIYVSMCASIYLPLIFLYLHVYLSLYFDLYLPIHLEIHIIYYIYLPFCIYSFPPAIYTSTYLPIFLCIYLYVFISLWIYLSTFSFFFYVKKICLSIYLFIDLPIYPIRSNQITPT